MTEALLLARDLKKYFPLKGWGLPKFKVKVRAVDGISLKIREGKTLGLVGESGCGKTTVAKLMIRAIEPTAGEVIFDGKNIFKLNRRELREFRRRVQYVYQDPYSSLDPRMKIGRMIAEAIKIYKIASGHEANRKVAAVLAKVGLPEESMRRYPHEFSGGQRQRIGIARSLVLNPELMILDEPVSALDVSIQAQVINLLTDLQDEFGLSYLLIAHDLGLIKQICDRVAVMYLGRIVEEAFTSDLFKSPKHPYTTALINAVPVPDPRRKVVRTLLEGEVANPIDPLFGCHFHERCPKRVEACERIEPELKHLGNSHYTACHLA